MNWFWVRALLLCLLCLGSVEARSELFNDADEVRRALRRWCPQLDMVVIGTLQKIERNSIVETNSMLAQGGIFLRRGFDTAELEVREVIRGELSERSINVEWYARWWFDPPDKEASDRIERLGGSPPPRSEGDFGIWMLFGGGVAGSEYYRTGFIDYEYVAVVREVLGDSSLCKTPAN